MQNPKKLMVNRLLKYKAFISYSHAADGTLAAALQSALHRFAKPWYRLRAMRIFRDQTGLSVNPALWPSIQQALNESEYFVFLASPKAAQSPWVQRELDYWIKYRNVKNLLLVLTEGAIVWDNDSGDFDWTRTDALPQNLRGLFASEPLYIAICFAKNEQHISLNHPQFRNVVADLAAALLSRDKDSLIGEDVRQHRLVLQLSWAAVITLAILTFLAGGAAYYANDKKNEAERRLGDSMMAGIVSANRSGDPLNAMKLGVDTRLLFQEQKRDTFEIDVELWYSYVLAPPPIWRVPLDLIPENSWLGFAPDSQNGLLFDKNCVDLIDVKTLRIKERFLESSKNIDYAAFSREGKLLFLMNVDQGIEIWDTSTRKLIRSLPASDYRLISSYASESAGLLVTTSKSYQTILWDLSTGDSIWELDRNEKIYAAALSADGSRLLTGHANGMITLWNVLDRTKIHTMWGGLYVAAVAMSDDLKLGLSGGENLILWDLKTGKRIRDYRQAREPVLDVAFMKNERKIMATGGYPERYTGVWDTESSAGYLFTGDVRRIKNSRFSSYGAGLLMEDYDKRILAFSISDSSYVVRSAHQRPVSTLEFSADQQILLTVGVDGSVASWDVQSGLLLASNFLGDSAINVVRFFDNDRKVLFGTKDGEIAVMAMDSLQIISRTKVQESPIADIAITLDNQRAISVNKDGTVRLWDTHSLKQIDSTKLPEKGTYVSLAEQDSLAVIKSPAAIYTWRWSDDSLTTLVSNKKMAGFAFSVSATDLLCTSGTSGELAVWDLKSRDVRWSKPGHGFGLMDCDFSPDHRWLVSTGHDKTLRFWDVETGRLLPDLFLNKRLWRASFAPDGQRVIATDVEGDLHFVHLGAAKKYFQSHSQVSQALADLRRDSTDFDALVTLARWYATRHIWTWSSQLLEEVRDANGEYPSIVLARSYLSQDRFEEASEEVARAKAKGEISATYFSLFKEAVTQELGAR